MISILSTNITSPLGFTTEENYRAVRSGASSLRSGAGGTALRRYEGMWGLPEPFAASLFSEEQNAALAIDGYTRFESIAIHSVREALSHTSVDIGSPRVILILSTTKADIGHSPADAAQRIATAIGLPRKPIVVCNACVSGLSAQLLADHLLSAGYYDYAIVVGAEVQSPFIVSGFQSLKAVSDAPCRPFDIERNGLNPGEAAATIVFERESPSVSWHLVIGAVRNDAYHISSPSPQADGLTAAIEAVMEGRDPSQLATVCVHGTATLYNDQMEAKAIQRTGLSDILPSGQAQAVPRFAQAQAVLPSGQAQAVPLSALKGYYGHTMGAAGVLETILTMRATDDGVVLPSKGFTELGVSGKVNISNTSQSLLTEGKTSFLKLLSGFGGCNVAALYTKAPSIPFPSKGSSVQWQKTHTVKLSSEDGKTLTDIYKQQIGDYPKFYKMDILTRLAFVAAELLTPLRLSRGEEPVPRVSSRGDIEGVILFNHSSSIVQDRQFFAPLRRRQNPSTISDAEDFFPSPSAFVYTLPNMTAGEIAIRHHICGDTSFYILPEKDNTLMQQILDASLRASNAQRVISGWVDAESETVFECELSIYEMKSEGFATALNHS